MEKIALSKMIAELRQELAQAQKQGGDDDLKFRVEDIELELKVVATEGGKLGAGVKFWVINAEGEGNYSSELVQTVRLKLKPEDSKGGNLKINSPEVSKPK